MTLDFWLKERLVSPRFTRVEEYYSGNFGYHLRLTDPAEFDAELEEWLCRSYGVGEQRWRA